MPRTCRTRTLATSARLVAFLAVAAVMGSGCAYIARVNTNGSTQANAPSTSLQIDGDGGEVAFSSDATNLVPDTNNHKDVFTRNTVTGANDRASELDYTNFDVYHHIEGNGDSVRPVISANGNLVAFSSTASNFDPNDANGTSDVFIRTMEPPGLGLRLVSTTPAFGVSGNGGSYTPSMDAFGNVVAFASFASNLVTSDTNGKEDVFVNGGGPSTLVSVATGGGLGNGNSFAPSVSADGIHVAFESSASNLVPGDTNGVDDIFVRDLANNTTTRVSVSNLGTQATGPSRHPSINGDGTIVAFDSAAGDLNPFVADTNGVDDVYVKNLLNGGVVKASYGVGGAQSNGASDLPSITGDAHYVGYESAGSNLVTGDTNATTDAFVYDMVNATTTRVSTDLTLNQANSASGGVSFSGDGRYVGFATAATNLVTPDTNGFDDVMLRANPIPTVSGASPSSLARGTAKKVTISGVHFLAPGQVSTSNAKITVTNLTVVNENTVTVTLTAASDAAKGPVTLYVSDLGTGAGSSAGATGGCTNCLTVT